MQVSINTLKANLRARVRKQISKCELVLPTLTKKHKEFSYALLLTASKYNQVKDIEEKIKNGENMSREDVESFSKDVVNCNKQLKNLIVICKKITEIEEQK